MNELKSMILAWSGSWSTGMESRALHTFTDELSVYPLEDVKRALDRARREWEQAKHPHLQFVIDRIESASSSQAVPVSGWSVTPKGVEWFGPAWRDLKTVRSHPEANLKIAEYVASVCKFQYPPSALEFFEILGVEPPKQADPRQGVFS